MARTQTRKDTKKIYELLFEESKSFFDSEYFKTIDRNGEPQSVKRNQLISVDAMLFNKINEIIRKVNKS